MKKIGTKLLLGILPVVIIAMVALTAISAFRGREIIVQQTQERMSAELGLQRMGIKNDLSVISNTAANISGTVSNSYKSMTQYNLEMTLQQVVEGNDSIYGSGVWFEPNVFSREATYMGPYVHRTGVNGAAIATTYDYSNAEYDYFNQEYYLKGKETMEPVFTSPYYDETSNIVMVTCVTSMYNSLGNFIGCVTVDMDLKAIQQMVSELELGEGTDAILLTGDTGTYLSNVDTSKVENSVSILDEENASLVQAGQQILSSESGIVNYKEGESLYRLYYDTVPDVDWKVIIRVPQAALNAPIAQLLQILMLVCVAAIVIVIIAILLQVSKISGGIRHVQKFAGTLAEGDFSIPQMKVRSADELGQMSKSLNVMYENNKDVLLNISEHAVKINDSSANLNHAADELLTQFEHITTLISSVNEAMMSASAATQEVNASSEEVTSSVNVLAEETEKSRQMSEEIKKRAHSIEESSKASYDYALKLSGQYEANLKKSIENAQVVESIGKMAEVISGIAKQIDLLSLNASIEAARAGEQGRGFAVVATEIGKMAGDTAKVVGEIQQTIEEVKQAFALLTEDSSSLIKFLKETVSPDYDSFVEVGRQYGVDAVAIEENAQKMSQMAAGIEGIMSEVANAVQNIAESAQNTANSSGQIMGTMQEVSGVVKEVSEMAGEQEAIAGDLNAVVGKFKLD